MVKKDIERLTITFPRETVKIIENIEGLGTNKTDRVKNAVMGFLIQNGYLNKKK
ncbi:MAG: hypothetical protein V1740_05975 [Candidatus Woesearchaeota archaeon]